MAGAGRGSGKCPPQLPEPRASKVTDTMASSSTKKLAEPPLRYLTKSLVKTALSCPRKIVYAANPKVYPRQDRIVEDPFVKHLAEEGKRFGDYCRRLFPHGVEIGPCSETKSVDTEPSQTIDELIAETNQVLSEQHQRTTIFEGAVRHGHFYTRPDILDKIVPDGRPASQTELRVIEVKAKSYDSRPNSKRGEIWNNKKKDAIRSNYLPYIQDVAFQTMVVRRAFPEYNVSSWLMLPDRNKTRAEKLDTDLPADDSHSDAPTVEETLARINESTATLINVDKLVEAALSAKVSFPGSSGASFEEVVEQWASIFCYNEDLESSFSDIHIGAHCALCNYRIDKDIHTETNEFKEDINSVPKSGFNVCWQQTTGLRDPQLKEPLIIDLYGYTKQSMAKFIEQERFLLRNLDADDFKSKQGVESTDKISSVQRQWYQIATLQTDSSNQYVLKKDVIQAEIEKWPYPWHFIDFETASPVLPYYQGMAPYELISYQFSHHVVYPDHKLCHASEFIHTDREQCPNKYFLRALCESIGNEGTVFQWSPFENTVLTSLLASDELAATLTPEQHDSLSSLLRNGSRPMVDLCRLASDYYYVDGSGGSSSIKKLLAPTMNASMRLKELYGAPNYSSSNFKDFQWYQQDEMGYAIDPYKILANIKADYCEQDELMMEAMSSVTHGGGAATAFHLLQSHDVSDNTQKEVAKSLLRYCELDTLSMAMIVQAWQGFLEEG